MRKTLTVPLALFTLALLAGSVMAQTDSKVRFGIRPTEAVEDRPETFSYFSYEASPGEVISDAAFILNSGFVPVSLHLYAADGFTAVNTGTAFTLKGENALGYSRGTRQWLSFSDADFRLEGAESVTVPFTVTVPLDATPGHHVAGLVVEAPPDENASVGEDGGQFSAIVVQQSAVAVVIDVPGAHVAGLEIISTCMKTQGDLGATFVVGVHNTGNIILKGEGSISLMDRDGAELASVPLEMGAVLPGDFTTFQVDHSIRLGDGEYLLSDVLNYEGETATFRETEFKVKDGQPEVGCDPDEDAEPPASFIEIVSPLRGGGSSLVRIGIFGGAALVLVLIILALIRRRRARGAGPEQPSDPKPPSSSTDGSDGTPGEAQPTKAPERTSKWSSITKFVSALIPRRRARASEPEQPSAPVPPSSSTDGSDGTPGEAQPAKAPERTSKWSSITKFVSALIPRRRARGAGPEQPSPPRPLSSSSGDSDGTPGEAQPTKAPERTSERSSITRRILALIPRRRAGASEPEQPSTQVPPSSSSGDSDETPGEAQPTKAPERTSERSSIMKFMSALIPRRRAGASEPEQPSAPMPPSSSTDGSDETPGEAQPQDGDSPSEAKMPSPPAFAPPARQAKSDEQAPEIEKPSPSAFALPARPAKRARQAPAAEKPSPFRFTPPPEPAEREQAPAAEKPSPVDEVTPPPEPAEREQVPAAEKPSPFEKVTPPPQPAEREQAPAAEKPSPFEVTPAPQPAEREQAPAAEKPSPFEVTPPPEPAEREQAPAAEKPSPFRVTPAPQPAEADDELPSFLLKQLDRSASPPETPPEEDSASSETAA